MKKFGLFAILTILFLSVAANDIFSVPGEYEPYEPRVMQASGGDMETEMEPMIEPKMKDKICPIKVGMSKHSYDEASMHGPMNWGKMSQEYKTCSEGRMQSPIDFPTDIRLSGMSCGAKLTFMTGRMIFKTMENNWKFLCQYRGTCGWMSFLGKKYFMNNVHFHHPSEHMMNGMRFPLEANFEYKSSDGRMMVIAVLMRYEQETDFLEQTKSRPLFDNGQEPMVKALLDVVKAGNSSTMVDISSIVDQRKGFCAYMGSMTAPPCTEGVTYLMSMNTPVVSKRQVHAIWVSTGFSLAGNSRPVTPLNNREVTCYLG